MIGALIGDIVGSRFEFDNIKTKEFEYVGRGTNYTDDSVLTLAIAEIVQNGWANDKDKVIDTIKKWARTYPDCGFGGGFYHWMRSDKRDAYNSCGNGSAMRVSACGWYGKDEQEVVDLATKVTEVTHNHPEGIKGAVVTALCIYYARTNKSKEFIKEFVSKFYNLDFDYEELRRTYVHDEEICQCTVPQAIYCFLISKDFEDCLRTTISIGGDCDTTAAISCAIAEAYYKDIPDDLMRLTEIFIPQKKNGCNARQIIDNFLSIK